MKKDAGASVEAELRAIADLLPLKPVEDVADGDGV